MDGHWKCNCPKYLAKLAEKKRQNGKSNLGVLEAVLVEVNTSSWIVDSGVTNHVCSSLQLLRSFKVLAEGELTICIGNRATVSVKTIGEVRLQFGARYLGNDYFILNFSRNLISDSMLTEQSIGISFNNNKKILFQRMVSIYVMLI